MKTISLAILATFLLSCASVDDDAPPPRRRAPMRAQAGALDLLPPPNWWHDPEIAAPVKLSDAQFASLDEVGRENIADIDRLRADARDAERDLRQLLNAEQPTASELTAAGTRLRTLRDGIVDHEMRMLAGERALLTRAQWTSLQDALRDERQSERGGRRGGGFGGGRGGRRGGGGRRPW